MKQAAEMDSLYRKQEIQDISNLFVVLSRIIHQLCDTQVYALKQADASGRR